jgi:hypothetical protein
MVLLCTCPLFCASLNWSLLKFSQIEALQEEEHKKQEAFATYLRNKEREKGWPIRLAFQNQPNTYSSSGKLKEFHK